MGRPSDRSKGVKLVTDYGALEWALAKRDELAAKAAEEAKTKN